MRRPRLIRAAWASTGAAWGLAAAAGLWALHAYESAPGRPGSPDRRWPADSRVRPDPTRANLVLLAPPSCPCPRASLDELKWIVGARPGAAAVHVLFFRPG